MIDQATQLAMYKLELGRLKLNTGQLYSCLTVSLSSGQHSTEKYGRSMKVANWFLHARNLKHCMLYRVNNHLTDKLIFGRT